MANDEGLQVRATTSDPVVPTGMEARPLPSGLETGDQYGDSVALNEDGTLMAVGADQEDVDGTDDVGAVYVYERGTGGWDRIARLTPLDLSTHGHFGATLAWGTDHLAVGAPDWDGPQGSGVGAAFTYSIGELRDGDPRPTVLFSPVGADSGLFGNSLAFGDERLVVGDNTPGNLYVFNQTTESWEHTHTIGKDTDRHSAGFGASGTLALDGGVLAAGAVSFTNATTPHHAGAVFLYHYHSRNDTWTHTQTLTAPEPHKWGAFGPLGLDGDTLAVGEPGAQLNTGRLHVYQADGDDRSPWSHQTTFLPERLDGRMGERVAVEGDVILAGAPSEEAQMRGVEAPENSVRWMGHAYWYERTANGSWQQAADLLAPVPTPETMTLGNRFGARLDLSEGTAVVTARGGTDNHPEASDLQLLGEDAEFNVTGRVTTFGPDPDRDFLATSWEHDAGTPPRDPDPDGDGLGDGLEVVRWLSDPFDPDTDNDTLTDGTEAHVSKTQTRDPDTDGDGFSDAIEVHGLTVEGTQVLTPSDPNRHDRVPGPVGPVDVPVPFLHPRRDVSPTPPVDQPQHWPGYVEDHLAESTPEDEP